MDYSLPGPLSPVLHQTLVDRFGRVVIANEGEPFHGSAVRSSHGKGWELRVSVSGEYYRVPCPYCKDTRPRLWINHRYGQTDQDGKPFIHLAICYNEDCLAKEGRRWELWTSLFGFRNKSERTLLPIAVSQDTGTGFVKPELPGDIEPLTRLSAAHPAIKYLVEHRRYTREMIERWNIGYVVRAVPKYRLAQDRIYFPFHMNGEFVGWQCRYIGDVDWKATGIPKYYTMTSFKKSRCFYGYDLAKQYPFVVVCEGVTDAHRIGGPAVALLGKSMSSRQTQLLLETWAGKPIVLLLDPEALIEMEGMLADLTNQRRSAPVVSIRLPEGLDPGSMEQTAIWDFIQYQAKLRNVELPAVRL